MIAFYCAHCGRERCDRATLVIVTDPAQLGPDPGPNRRPLIGAVTACPHGAWAWVWESPHEPITEADKALLVGQAGEDHFRQFGCPCFADGARVRVGLPPDWQQPVALVHQLFGPLQ
jgi:hypothetical protein